MSLRDLYQEIIIDHGKTPRNFGKLASANCMQLGHNPLCGDQVIVYVNKADDKIEDVKFEGNGCAISVASASLMTEIVKGKSLASVQDLFENFHRLVIGDESVADQVGKLAAFSNVASYPARVKCATLAWHTLNAALVGSAPQPIKTE